MCKNNAIIFTRIMCMCRNQKFKMEKAKTHKKFIKKNMFLEY